MQHVSKGAGRLLSETMRGHQLQHQLQRAGTLESCSRRLRHRSGEDPGAPSSSVFIRKSPSWGAANTVLADLGFILGSSCYGSSCTDCFTSPQLTSGSLYFPSWISGDAHFCNVRCLKVEDLAIITSISATKDSHYFKYYPPPPHQLQLLTCISHLGGRFKCQF